MKRTTNNNPFLSPADDTASRALIDTQTLITKVKEIVTECVVNGVNESETTARLNKAIASECKRIQNIDLREQTRKALVAAARKWHYELKQTYRILNRNLQEEAKSKGVDFSGLLNLTPVQRNVEFRKILDDGTSPGIPLIEDYERSVKLAIKAMSAEPPKVVTVTRKDGKKYTRIMPLRNRAEMSVRYDANVKNMQELVSLGVLWAWTSSHPNCSPRCKDWQGRLYSLFKGTVEINGTKYGEEGYIDSIKYEPIDNALRGDNGDGNGIISGYNCRHRLIAYKPGSKPPTDYSEAEIAREYAIDKQQRSYENRIRQMKTEERLLRIEGKTKEASVLRKRWRRLTIDYQIFSIENKRAFYRHRCVIDRAEVDEAEKIKQAKSLTESQSDVIITNENIKQSFGEKTYSLQEIIEKSNPIILSAFDKYQKKLKIIDSKYSGTAYFSQKKGGIFFNLEEDSQPSNNYRKQFSSYFHETGHNFDFIIGKKIGGAYASGTYQSPNFNNATFNDTIIEEGMAFIETYRVLVAKKENKTLISNEDVYKAIYDDYAYEKIADTRQLSDILDGITNGEMERLGYSLGASHTIKTKDYWDFHPVGREAFAHFTCILTTNPKQLEILINIFPNSFAIYKEIMKL